MPKQGIQYRGVGIDCESVKKSRYYHPNLLPNCSYRARTRECVDKRATYKLFDYSEPELNESVVWTHKACVCNEICALTKRHQYDTGAMYVSEGDVILQELDKLVKSNNGYYPLTRNTFQQVINHYSGAKRAEYERGAKSLESEHLDIKKDAKVRMFLKDDKYNISESGFEFKPPRCIQFRNKRYGISLAAYLQPLEHEVYTLRDVTGTRVFAKSRNLDDRAKDLAAKWAFFKDPVALCLDHSKFDCHVKVEHLEQEHEFYKRWFPSDRKLAKLLRMQKRNRGSTRNGTTYRTMATRMSGDQNTGLGNSVINYGMLAAFMGKRKAGYYIDGDDSVIIIERSDLRGLSVKFFSEFGMSTKLEVVKEFESIEFCQCRPVFDGVSWHMVRNPFRALARLPWVVKKNHLSCIGRYIKSVGMCELSMNLGIPVMQHVATAMIQYGDGKYMITDRHYMAKTMKIKPWNSSPVPIRSITRESFARAWGISVEDQIRFENVSLSRPVTDVEAILMSMLPTGATL